MSAALLLGDAGEGHQEKSSSEQCYLIHPCREHSGISNMCTETPVMSSKDNHTFSKKTMRYEAHSTGQHPLLGQVAVGASENSADIKYSDVVRWKHSTPIPAQVANLIVRGCVPTQYQNCGIIFSGLDSDVAGDIEMAFLKQILPSFRMLKTYDWHFSFR